jgi:hypothetical protein
MFSITIDSLKSVIDGYKDVLPAEILESSEEFLFVADIVNQLGSKFQEIFGDSVKLEIDRGYSNNYIGVKLIKESSGYITLFAFSKYKNNKYTLHSYNCSETKQINFVKLKKLIMKRIKINLKSQNVIDRLTWN